MRRPNLVTQDKLQPATIAVAAIAATTTLMLCTLDGDIRVDSFEITAPGGFAADAANYWTITLQSGATVLATWSTQTGQQGALTDGVLSQAVLAATPVGTKGAALKVVITKSGSAANLPAGSRFVAHVHQF